MKYTFHFNTMGFYPNRNWFFHYNQFKFISGFTLRVCGLILMVKEENSLQKLIAINKAQQEAKLKKS